VAFLIPTKAWSEWFSEKQAIMGTEISVELWAKDSVEGRAAIAAVMTEMKRIDAWLSPYKTASELSQVNLHATKEAFKISPELFQLIEKSNHYSELSEGAFDITFASLGNQYDYRLGIRPSQSAIDKQLKAINYRHIKLDPVDQTILFVHPDVKIDLGGIAKGYAVDLAINLLLKRGIISAMVAAGGDTRIIGDKEGKPWMVGIKAPRDANGVALVIPLDNSAISTSGDYERYFESGGVRYHHILNPHTGDSARLLQSVSIIGDNAVDTDALSTTVFVLGLDKGMALINQLKGFDAIVIDNQGKLYYSDGLAKP